MENNKYCFSCGTAIHVDAEVCPHCGANQRVQNPNAYQFQKINKNWLTSFLLCLALGFFGIHRFYLKRTGSGILMLLTIGGFGIWWIADIIIMATGNFKDKDGSLIRQLNEN